MAFYIFGSVPVNFVILLSVAYQQVEAAKKNPQVNNPPGHDPRERVPYNLESSEVEPPPLQFKYDDIFENLRKIYSGHPIQNSSHQQTLNTTFEILQLLSNIAMNPSSDLSTTFFRNFLAEIIQIARSQTDNISPEVHSLLKHLEQLASYYLDPILENVQQQPHQAADQIRPHSPVAGSSSEIPLNLELFLQNITKNLNTYLGKTTIHYEYDKFAGYLGLSLLELHQLSSDSSLDLTPDRFHQFIDELQHVLNLNSRGCTECPVLVNLQEIISSFSRGGNTPNWTCPTPENRNFKKSDDKTKYKISKRSSYVSSSYNPAYDTGGVNPADSSVDHRPGAHKHRIPARIADEQDTYQPYNRGRSNFRSRSTSPLPGYNGEPRRSLKRRRFSESALSHPYTQHRTGSRSSSTQQQHDNEHLHSSFPLQLSKHPRYRSKNHRQHRNQHPSASRPPASSPITSPPSPMTENMGYDDEHHQSSSLVRRLPYVPPQLDQSNPNPGPSMYGAWQH